jgi:hypothetical protein
VFVYDIFQFAIESGVYTYANDNTLFHFDSRFSTMKTVLERDSISMIEWFSDNGMKANPDKFQEIALRQKKQKMAPVFNIGGVDIACETEVKLFCVTIDFRLKFDKHISEICKKSFATA